MGPKSACGLDVMRGRIVEELFEVWVVRAIIGALVFLRGWLFLLFGQVYKASVDYCWVYRVSDVEMLKVLALSIIKRIIKAGDRRNENLILNCFLTDRNALLAKESYSMTGKGNLDLLRDVIVLKKSIEKEKGVVLIKYTPTFDAFLAFFDIDAIMERYYIVLEPSWAGYCDPSILMFLSANHRVVIQCFTDEDQAFISNLDSNLCPIRLGPADWIDPDIFVCMPSQAKVYDLVMVANWARHKQHIQLFNALRKIKDRKLRVLLIGFEWGGRTKADILKETAGLNGHLINLEIMENIPQKEIARYLVQSKVFVYLSKKEGDNKAVVEAFLCNVPAIVYKDTIGGINSRINQQTGVRSSFQDLHETIVYMLDHYQSFSPREWALQNVGCSVATQKLNAFLKDLARVNQEAYSSDIVVKSNSPNLRYAQGASRHNVESDYEFIQTAMRV